MVQIITGEGLGLVLRQAVIRGWVHTSLGGAAAGQADEVGGVDRDEHLGAASDSADDKVARMAFDRGRPVCDAGAEGVLIEGH